MRSLVPYSLFLLLSPFFVIGAAQPSTVHEYDSSSAISLNDLPDSVCYQLLNAVLNIPIDLDKEVEMRSQLQTVGFVARINKWWNGLIYKREHGKLLLLNDAVLERLVELMKCKRGPLFTWLWFVLPHKKSIGHCSGIVKQLLDQIYNPLVKASSPLKLVRKSHILRLNSLTDSRNYNLLRTVHEIGERFGIDNGWLCELLKDKGLELSTHAASLPEDPVFRDAYYGTVSTHEYDKKSLEAVCDNLLPLEIASLNGHYSVVKSFLSCGANPNKIGPLGRSALSYATGRDHEAIVQLLIDHGASIDWRDRATKQNLLHYVARTGNKKTAQRLLGNARALLEEKDFRSRTPLFLAAENNYLPLVQLFCNAGASLAKANNDTPLLIALASCQERDINLFARTLACTADINQKYGGWGSLEWACFFGHEEYVVPLLERGADIDVERGRPLLAAVSTGKIMVVRRILERVAKLAETHECNLDDYINKRLDGTTQTGLMFAANLGHTELVRLLLDWGADKEIMDGSGRKAINFATNDGIKEQLSQQPALKKMKAEEEVV